MVIANIDARPLIFKLITWAVFLPIYVYPKCHFPKRYRSNFIKIRVFLRFFAKICLYLLMVMANIIARPLIFKLITWALIFTLYVYHNVTSPKNYRPIFTKKFIIFLPFFAKIVLFLLMVMTFMDKRPLILKRITRASFMLVNVI
jgi:hypothetical protein